MYFVSFVPDVVAGVVAYTFITGNDTRKVMF